MGPGKSPRIYHSSPMAQTNRKIALYTLTGQSASSCVRQKNNPGMTQLFFYLLAITDCQWATRTKCPFHSIMFPSLYINPVRFFLTQLLLPVLKRIFYRP